MRKFCIVLVMFLSVGALTAQEATAKGQDTPAKREVSEIPKQFATPAYRMAFSIYELQEGKRINQRDFSLILVADDRGGNKIKLGTKIPLDIGENKITYTDVGIELECSAAETINNKLSVRIELGLSSFPMPDQNPRTAGERPVLRAVSQRLRTMLTPGKPQVITSMDDVNSNKRMQVEVLATKLD